MVARVMAAVPDIPLRLDVPGLTKSEMVRIHAEVKAAGIDPNRVTIDTAVYNSEYRERLAPLALGLDSFPFGCYFSAIQSLSAGLPLLTFPGATPTGRGAAAIMNAAGIGELICADQPEMEARAIALLRDPQELNRLRRVLPERMRASMLNDLPGTATRRGTCRCAILAKTPRV